MLVLGRVYKLQVYIYQKIIHDSCRKIYRRPMDPMPTEKRTFKKSSTWTSFWAFCLERLFKARSLQVGPTKANYDPVRLGMKLMVTWLQVSGKTSPNICIIFHVYIRLYMGL